ncbi:hypothetical protein EV126DRAFT_59965 [Verticillium dahliae]|nr:hypothetical protein EV126DRAFT_59965 [Verticillium dahliae]
MCGREGKSSLCLCLLFFCMDNTTFFFSSPPYEDRLFRFFFSCSTRMCLEGSCCRLDSRSSWSAVCPERRNVRCEAFPNRQCGQQW